MRLINPAIESYPPQAPGIEGIYKQVERVGRTCYKSEDKITEDSAEPFVNRMIKSSHLAMCEHGTVYMQADANNDDIKFWQVANSPYTRIICNEKENILYVTTNLRVLVENDAMRLLDEYLCEPTEQHIKRICLKFNTSIGVSREGNRSRTFSIAEMSTRYCNFSKDKFNNELTFIIPQWLHLPTGSYDYWDGDWCDVNKMKIQCNADEQTEVNDYLWSLHNAELYYMKLINMGWKPQQAREVLPLSLATEVVYTAFEEDWSHFFDLRYRETTGPAHPNMKEIATLAHDVILKELGKDL